MRPYSESILSYAVARYFDTRRNIVVPNVSWGFRGINYEIDVLVVTVSRHAYHIEVKISIGDLKRDIKKHKWNYCMDQGYFRKFYYVIPETMIDSINLIPDFAGVLVVGYDDQQHQYITTEFKRPHIFDNAQKVTDHEMINLGRLCMMRLWNEYGKQTYKNGGDNV